MLIYTLCNTHKNPWSNKYKYVEEIEANLNLTCHYMHYKYVKSDK